MNSEQVKYLVKNIFGNEAEKDDDIVDFYINVNEEAMEEYAKQKAIAFKEWQDPDLEERKWENYDGHDTWINPHTMEVISTEKLYERFLKDTK